MWSPAWGHDHRCLVYELSGLLLSAFFLASAGVFFYYGQVAVVECWFSVYDISQGLGLAQKGSYIWQMSTC